MAGTVRHAGSSSSNTLLVTFLLGKTTPRFD